MPKNHKKYLAEARLYRFLAMVFAVTGLIVFIMLYIQNIDGRLLGALMEPLTIFLIIFPFLPAIVLSWLAKTSEKKYFSAESTKSVKK